MASDLSLSTTESGFGVMRISFLALREGSPKAVKYRMHQIFRHCLFIVVQDNQEHSQIGISTTSLNCTRGSAHGSKGSKSCVLCQSVGGPSKPAPPKKKINSNYQWDDRHDVLRMSARRKITGPNQTTFQHPQVLN